MPDARTLRITKHTKPARLARDTVSLLDDGLDVVWDYHRHHSIAERAGAAVRRAKPSVTGVVMRPRRGSGPGECSATGGEVTVHWTTRHDPSEPLTFFTPAAYSRHT